LRWFGWWQAGSAILTRALRILTSFLTLAVPPSFLLWPLRFLMLPRGMWFLSDAAALSYDVAVVLFDGSCAVAVILSDAAPPFLMGLVLWCYLLFSTSLPSSA